MSSYLIAPAVLIRGEYVVREAPPALAALGRRLLWVEGASGGAALPTDLPGELRNGGARVHGVRHAGPCSDGSVAALREAAMDADADVVVAVGGGRVLDAAKAAADDLALPFAAIPTSPATCAAVTPVAVMYDGEARYLRTRPTRRAPDLAILDTDVLAAAPDRLLVAGVLDALAKIHEVRRTLGDAAGRSAGAAAALALCDDLERTIDAHADAALAPRVAPQVAPTFATSGGASAGDAGARRARRLLAEACVLTPGLIGGLAGEEAKLAAAHPLHNALTALPGSRSALHGELVGFGVLVQMDLAGAAEADVRAEAARYARWGVPCHLASLGCATARSDAGRAVAQATVETVAMRTAFPGVDTDTLFDAVLRVDAWSRAEAQRAAVTTG